VHFKSTRVTAGTGACGVAALLGITALAATASIPTRHALLDQLQRAAIPQHAAASRDLQVVRRAGNGYSVTVVLTPNRASGPNRLSVRLAGSGRPLGDAQVTVAFSMPSMKMWNGYTATLAPAGAGRYLATVPVIGMAGRWQLRLDVVRRAGRGFGVTVDDRMHR
jgi:hypothetical protein